MQAELMEALGQLPGALVLQDEPLSRHVPLRLGGPVDLWVTCEDQAALGAVLSAARKSKVNWRIHWPFADWLVRDGGVRGLVVRLGTAFESVRYEGELCWIGSAALWSALAGRPSAPALESLSRWPGSVGGLLCSADRERLGGMVASLRWLRGRKVEQVDVPLGEPIPEVPATAALLEVALRPEVTVQKGRRKPRLVPPPHAGALFQTADGQPAEGVIGRSGLGGARLRSWRMTPAGSVIQLGGGTCKDVLLLAQGLQERVEKERGVALQTRLPIVGVEARV